MTDFPRAEYAVRDQVWIATGRAVDEITGEPRHGVGIYVRVGEEQRVIERLRRLNDEPSQQRYDRSACPLDRPCRCLERR